VLVAVWLIVNTLQTSPVESGMGLLLIALGLPVYLYYRYTRRRTAREGVQVEI